MKIAIHHLGELVLNLLTPALKQFSTYPACFDMRIPGKIPSRRKEFLDQEVRLNEPLVAPLS
jgi:hypothetical protein